MRVSLPSLVTALLLGLIGLFLVGGGGWLVTLGGSPFHAAHS